MHRRAAVLTCVLYRFCQFSKDYGHTERLCTLKPSSEYQAKTELNLARVADCRG